MDWFGILFVVFLLVTTVQPALQARTRQVRRARLIAQIEQERGSRVITMIHRQETQRLFSIPVSRMIDLEDAQQIIPAIQATPPGTPIDLILHTPGGMVVAAMQIARALKAHPSHVTVYVPVYAMSGGTLLALAADEIVMDTFSMLGPIDPQIAGIPAASIVAAKREKQIADVNDLTLIFADMSEKALKQVKAGALEIIGDDMPKEQAIALVEKLAGGTWTHDYALTADEARSLGLKVRSGIPQSVLELMRLYPQPVRHVPSVDFLPVSPSRLPAQIPKMS